MPEVNVERWIEGDIMALVECPECREPISSKVAVCPKCGFKRKRQWGCLLWFLGVNLLVVLLDEGSMKLGQMLDMKRRAQQHSGLTEQPAPQQQSVSQPLPRPEETTVTLVRFIPPPNSTPNSQNSDLRDPLGASPEFVRRFTEI
jgi:hypothetical protein